MKVRITDILVFFLIICMIWLFTVTPFGQTKENALWNITVVGSLAGFFLTKKLWNETEIRSGKEFAEFFAIGTISGIFISFLAAAAIQSTNFIWNLVGSVAVSSIASMTIEQAFWVVLVQPLSETILLTFILLFIFEVLKRNKIPATKPISIFLAAAIFASLHFAVLGAAGFENSFVGFLNFVGSPNGAFPQMLLGVFWSILILGYGNWVVAYSAHLVNNLLAFFSANPTKEVAAFTLLIGGLIIILTAFGALRTRFRIFDGFKMKEVL